MYDAIAILLGLLALIILWQVFAFGPRRRRGLKRVRRRLAAGAWQDALQRVRKLRRRGFPSAGWITKFNEAEAACLRAAAQTALADKRFEEALEHLSLEAQVLGNSAASARLTVQAAMLEEARRLFSVTTLGDNKAVHDLLVHAQRVQAPCREAFFWQALCFLRGGETDRALESLQNARASSSPGEMDVAIDPPLYLGALLLRQGKAKESLKYLTEANRIDANCPVVTLQLGAAMIAADGDTTLAVRALQRALGPKGLPLWEQEPRKLWLEGFPEGRSYVRKLAAAYPFVCPLWGSDLLVLRQQGNLALAQGYYKLAAYQEAADLFGKVLQNGAPSVVVLRGLGLSLARLGKYDDAFKHLRIAHEMEEPKDRLTAGYLALCGAKGKPSLPEDKARNILWALQVIMRFGAPGDVEWANLAGSLFAEARDEGVALTLDDQLYLCEHLWSVHDTTPQAARAFHHLQATFPRAVRPEYAWLYCRAAEQHQLGGEHALALFARTFADRGPASDFFAARQWDLDAVELTYLERAAALAPGQFPKSLGPDYPAHGEDLLLAQVRTQENGGQLDAALATATVLVHLAPQSARALDRLAYLHHRSGNQEEAVALLETCHQHHPHDPTPLVRLALLLHQRGSPDECQSRLRAALELCAGPPRAPIAFLAARLTLRDALSGPATSGSDGAALHVAEDYLRQCLADDPGHTQALWCLAALRWLRGDAASLATQAAAMNRDEPNDARFQFFTGLCRLAAEDFAGVLESRERIVAGDPALADNEAPKNGVQRGQHIIWSVEAAYLAGLANLGLGQQAAATRELEKTAAVRESPSASHAQAQLGAIAFMDNRPEDAAKWWQLLDQKQLAGWKLDETLAQTVFLSALENYARGGYEQAAERLRAAGKLGCRDRQLGALLVLALFKAGQKLVFGDVEAATER